MASLFQYQPLDHTAGAIRLLKLKETDTNSELVSCSLENANIADSRYYALSYVWRDSSDSDADGTSAGSEKIPKERLNIILNDEDNLVVQPNLWKFLRQAQSSFADVFLWIDAICIDQNNPSEVNQQVQQMGQIYGCARKVLVWLGDGRPLIQELFWHMDSRLWDDSFDQLPQSELQRLFYAMYCFNSNIYWERLWVVQEILHASDITLIHGDSSVSWDVFWDGIDVLNDTWLRKTDYRVSVFGVSASRFRQQRLLHKKRGNQYYNFGELLELYQSAKCERKNDLIFGILSLLEKGKDFEVSYADSLSKLSLRAWNTWRASPDDFLLLQQIEKYLGIPEERRLADWKQKIPASSLSPLSQIRPEFVVFDVLVMEESPADLEKLPGRVVDAYTWKKTCTLSCKRCNRKVTVRERNNEFHHIVYCLCEVGSTKYLHREEGDFEVKTFPPYPRFQPTRLEHENEPSMGGLMTVVQLSSQRARLCIETHIYKGLMVMCDFPDERTSVEGQATYLSKVTVKQIG